MKEIKKPKSFEREENDWKIEKYWEIIRNIVKKSKFHKK